MKSLPPQNKRKRGGPAFVDEAWRTHVSNGDPSQPSNTTLADPSVGKQLSLGEALERLAIADSSIPQSSSETRDGMSLEADTSYCHECYLPLHPDPKPENLYIFLHALRYTTSLGTFETDIAEWAKEGWVWDRE